MREIGNNQGIKRWSSKAEKEDVKEGNESRGEATARLPPIQMWNNGYPSVCQHLQAQRE